MIPNAVPVLLNKLSDPDPAVGLYVAQALGDLTPANDLPELRAELSDQNADVRFRSALALGDLRDAGAVPGLTVALRDGEPAGAERGCQSPGEDRQWAGYQCADQGAGQRPAVCSARVHGRPGEPRRHGCAGAEPGLLTSPETRVRLHSATVLGYIASPEARSALQLATIDPDFDVRNEVRWALDELAQ